MLEEPSPREELFIVHISFIPAFSLPTPLKHLGFYVGGKLRLCVYFQRNFSVGNQRWNLSISFIDLLRNWSQGERRTLKWVFRETSTPVCTGSCDDAREKANERAQRLDQARNELSKNKRSGFAALLRRRFFCDVLLSNGGRIFSFVVSFHRSLCISIWCYCCCLVVDLLQVIFEDCVTLSN